MYSVFIWVLSGNGINPWQIENRKHDDTSLDLVLYVEKTHMFMHEAFQMDLIVTLGVDLSHLSWHVGHVFALREATA